MQRQAQPVHWGVELLPNPAQLIRNDWSRVKWSATLKPGTAEVVTVAPSKVGGVVGLLRRVTSVDGVAFITGGGALSRRQIDPDAGRQGGAGRGSN